MKTAVKITRKARNSTFDKCKIYGWVEDSWKGSRFKKTNIGLKQYKMFDKSRKIILEIIGTLAAIVTVLNWLNIWPFNFFQSKKTETAPIIVDSTFINNSPNSTNIINKLDIPEAKITMETLSINQPVWENFQSEFIINVDTKIPLGNLSVEAYSQNIVSISASPQRSGTFQSNDPRIREDFASINIPNVFSGNYKITVVTSKKEEVEFKLNYE